MAQHNRSGKPEEIAWDTLHKVDPMIHDGLRQWITKKRQIPNLWKVEDQMRKNVERCGVKWRRAFDDMGNVHGCDDE